MLFGRIAQLLAAEHCERAGESPAGIARRDYVVDKAAARSDKRVCEFLAVFFGAGLDCRGVAKIGAKDDLDRALLAP